MEHENHNRPKTAKRVRAGRYHVPLDKFIGNAGLSQWSICEWVPPETTVLDVGCASGSVAQYLSEQKNCRVVGVERDSRFARKARAYCDRVYIGDIESESVLMKIRGRFDAIVFADILEHLQQPEKALHAARKLLKKDGCVFVSIPNFANWRIRLRLLSGRFEYTDTGILDRTHLRFFTRQTAVQLLHSCDFKIIGMKTTSGKGRWFPMRLSAIVPGLFAYQFIFKAIKCQPSRS